jgi:hypothetical protein
MSFGGTEVFSADRGFGVKGGAPPVNAPWV